MSFISDKNIQNAVVSMQAYNIDESEIRSYSKLLQSAVVIDNENLKFDSNGKLLPEVKIIFPVKNEESNKEFGVLAMQKTHEKGFELVNQYIAELSGKGGQVTVRNVERNGERFFEMKISGQDSGKFLEALSAINNGIAEDVIANKSELLKKRFNAITTDEQLRIETQQSLDSLEKTKKSDSPAKY